MRREFLIGLLMLVACGCTRENRKILPAELLGFWTTDAPRYHECFLELTATYVIIGTGAHAVEDIQIVDSFDKEQFGDDSRYLIYSSDMQGNHYQLALRLNPAHGGQLQIRNQSNIWKRESDGVAAP